MTEPDRLEQAAALVALLRTRPEGTKWSEVMGDVLLAGSAVDVWEAQVGEALLEHPQQTQALADARQDVQEWVGDGITVTTVLDHEYPSRLRAVHQAPPVLFSRGDLQPHDRAVSVVGSRQASAEGLNIADVVSRALVREGITVLSGLAAGIDTAAHVAALDEGGRTVAVIGTGIRRYYPPGNHDLQNTIAERGLLLSQFWPDSPATKHSFPIRNATMSGYGLATVVVEAGETSGARIQARVAVEHGRPVVLTGLVVEANLWARKLIGRPGVHRADGRDEILAILRDLDAQQEAAHRAASAALAG